MYEFDLEKNISDVIISHVSKIFNFLDLLMLGKRRGGGKPLRQRGISSIRTENRGRYKAQARRKLDPREYLRKPGLIADAVCDNKQEKV